MSFDPVLVIGSLIFLVFLRLILLFYQGFQGGVYILNETVNNFVFLGGVITLAGIFVIYSAKKVYRRNRLILDTPTSKVRSIAMGKVELYGTALPYEGKLMKTPFGMMDCLWCEWSITVVPEEMAYVGTGDQAYRASGVIDGLFWLQDNTGKVLVYTKGADIEARYRRETRRGFDESVKAFLQEKGKKLPIVENLVPAVYEAIISESYLAPNEKVYVLGTAKKNPLKHKEEGDQEEDIIITSDKDIFYISTKPYNKIHEYAKGGLLVFLVIGSALIVAGVALIIFNL